MRLLVKKFKCRRGSALMQYLLLVVVAVALIAPILVSKFGGPFMRTMGNERQKMVNFFAQTPKNRQRPPVPASWFSQELPPKIETEQIQVGEEISDSRPIETGDIQEGGKIRADGMKGGQTLAGGQAIGAGQVRGGGNISAGGVSQGGGAGGNDFFSAPPTPGMSPQQTTASSGQSNAGGATKRSQGGTLVAEGGESVGGVSSGQSGSDKKDKGGKEESQMLSDKKSSLASAEQELKDRERRSNFDWWLLIKVLIGVGIIALLFLILLGNSRRTN